MIYGTVRLGCLSKVQTLHSTKPLIPTPYIHTQVPPELHCFCFPLFWTNSMESNVVDNDASRILRELKNLKDTKSRIEQKISVLEAQLREINLQNEVANNGSCPPSSIVNLEPRNGLTPDMIYRYSRHLLLPSFGVEGFVQFSLQKYYLFSPPFLFCYVGLSL